MGRVRVDEPKKKKRGWGGSGWMNQKKKRVGWVRVDEPKNKKRVGVGQGG